jgi:hypothetical protein
MRTSTRNSLLLGSVALVAAAIAVTNPSALGWAAGQSFGVRSQVSKFCSYSAGRSFSGLNNFTASVGGGSTSVATITAPINGSGILQAASFVFNATATCNAPSQVTLTSSKDGMTDSVSPITSVAPGSTGSFLNRINYTASASWANTSVTTLTTDGVGSKQAQADVTAARTGTFAVAVSIIPNATTPVLSGGYTDTLTIKIEPK